MSKNNEIFVKVVGLLAGLMVFIGSMAEGSLCVQLGSQCAICPDLKKQKSPKDLMPVSMSDYDCSRGAGRAVIKQKPEVELLLVANDCIALSSFCAICRDGTFLSPQSAKPLASDLYECSTHPRVRTTK